jgi:hypothetical protein
MTFTAELFKGFIAVCIKTFNLLINVYFVWVVLLLSDKTPTKRTRFKVIFFDVGYTVHQTDVGKFLRSSYSEILRSFYNDAL